MLDLLQIAVQLYLIGFFLRTWRRDLEELRRCTADNKRYRLHED